MAFRFRRRLSLGPLRFNITERGLRSTSVKIGPFTRNLTRGKNTVNLPDGAYYESSSKPAARRQQRCPSCGRF